MHSPAGYQGARSTPVNGTSDGPRYEVTKQGSYLVEPFAFEYRYAQERVFKLRTRKCERAL